jgi:hypothetical protein
MLETLDENYQALLRDGIEKSDLKFWLGSPECFATLPVRTPAKD